MATTPRLNRYQCPRCLIPRCVEQSPTGEWKCTNGNGTMYECGFTTSVEEELQRMLMSKLEKRVSDQSQHKHCCIACALSERDEGIRERSNSVREDMAKLETRIQSLEQENESLRRQLAASKQQQQKQINLQKRMSSPSLSTSALRNLPPSSSRRVSGRLYQAMDTEAEQDTIEARGRRNRASQSASTLRVTPLGRSTSTPIEIGSSSSCDESKEAVPSATVAHLGVYLEEEDVESPTRSPDGDMLTPRGRHTRGGSDAAVLSSKFCADPLRYLSRVLMANPKLSMALDGIGDWDFDIFAFQRIGLVEHHPILVLGHALLTRHNLFDKFGLDERKTLNWLTRIESGYNEIPYHNNLHGADVMLSASFWFDLESFGRVYDDFDRLVLILAGAAHDVGHTGMNNKYHRAIESNLATLYNDQSVLENYHVSFAFQIMKKHPECDWLSDLDHEYRSRARNLMVSVILGTDMEKHGAHVKQLRALTGKPDSGSERDSSVPMWSRDLSEDERKDILVNAFHFGDIGNSCKTTDLCLEWANRIVEEFRQQGDAEKRNGWVSDKIFDRSTSMENIQTGWNKFVILPYSELFAELCPEAQFMVENCRRNLEFWTSFKEEQ